MKNQCINCAHFDGSKHQKDDRTKHAGICLKWSEITFKTDNCKQYLHLKEVEPVLVNVSKLPPIEQLSLIL